MRSAKSRKASALRAAHADRLDAAAGGPRARARQGRGYRHHHRAYPGRPAPVLLKEETVRAMKPGSVVVDMAIEQGGNCPLTERDRIVVKHGVKLVGISNLRRWSRPTRARSTRGTCSTS